jgi:hypothetical protein
MGGVHSFGVTIEREEIRRKKGKRIKSPNKVDFD